MVEMKTLLVSNTNLYSSRGGGVVIALASRSKFAQDEPVPNRQASQWAFGSQGFESLPRRHQHEIGQIPGGYGYLGFLKIFPGS